MKTKVIVLESVGSYFQVTDGVLEYSPMDDTGMPDWDMDGSISWYEVTAPESQEMIDGINRVFGTNYKLAEFAGR